MSNFLSGNVLDPNFKTRADARADEAAAERAAAAAWEAQQRAEYEADIQAADLKHKLLQDREAQNRLAEDAEAARMAEEKRRRKEAEKARKREEAEQRRLAGEPEPERPSREDDSTDDGPTYQERMRMRALALAEEEERERLRRLAEQPPPFRARCWKCDDLPPGDYTRKQFKSRGVADMSDHDHLLCDKCCERARRRAHIEAERSARPRCVCQPRDPARDVCSGVAPSALACEVCRKRERRREEVLAQHRASLRRATTVALQVVCVCVCVCVYVCVCVCVCVDGWMD